MTNGYGVFDRWVLESALTLATLLYEWKELRPSYAFTYILKVIY